MLVKVCNTYKCEKLTDTLCVTFLLVLWRVGISAAGSTLLHLACLTSHFYLLRFSILTRLLILSSTCCCHQSFLSLSLMPALSNYVLYSTVFFPPLHRCNSCIFNIRFLEKVKNLNLFLFITRRTKGGIAV